MPATRAPWPGTAPWLLRGAGRALALSPRTVKTHRSHLSATLQQESLAQPIRRFAVLAEDSNAA